MESKRVCIYCRVSTKDQTVENQLLDLRKYCQSRNWNIVAEYTDQGISGIKQDRPGLNEALTLARKRRIDVFLVWRFDRFARSLSHLVNTLDELHNLGVDFVSFQDGIDTSSPQGRMMFGVLASLAEFERSLIRERIMAGLRRAKAQGKQPGPRRASVDTLTLRQMHQEGRSVRAMASVLSVGKSTVQRLLSQIPEKSLVGAEA